MSTVEERLLMAEARLEILEVEGAYAATWDSGDAEGWSDLFSTDGVFEMVSLDGRPGERHEGRTALRDFCRSVNERIRGLHLLHLPTIRLADDGEHATSSLHFRFESGRLTQDTREIATVTGIYEVSYRRTDEGWRIAQRLERATARTSTAFHPGFYQ